MTWAEDYICKLSSEIHSVLSYADDYEELIIQLESLAEDIDEAATGLREMHEESNRYHNQDAC